VSANRLEGVHDTKVKLTTAAKTTKIFCACMILPYQKWIVVLINLSSLSANTLIIGINDIHWVES
jgi:hypothetical protein